MRIWPLLLLSPFLALAASAQNNSAKPGTGAVSGHVYCADTNAPARMASVQLESVKDVDERSAGQTHRASGLPAGDVVQTALDGSFTITKVPPGSYYVVASAVGYLSPRAHDEEFDSAEPQPPAGQPPLVIPKVDVQADQTSNVDIRVDRGAAVSGTVRFDDGSPATGVHIALMHKKKDKWVTSTFTGIMFGGALDSTDDLGHYRISGLRDREYILAARLALNDMISAGPHSLGFRGINRSSVTIYSGDTPHIADAVPFKLGVGEEHTGEDITIPLSKLHTISGVVTAARDGHAINAGSVQIAESGNDQPIASAQVGTDGSFHLECVPEGTYSLRIRNASDTSIQEVTVSENMTFARDKTLHQYGDLEQTIKVEGDIPNLVLAVPEKGDATAPNKTAASQ